MFLHTLNNIIVLLYNWKNGFKIIVNIPDKIVYNNFHLYLCQLDGFISSLSLLWLGKLTFLARLSETEIELLVYPCLLPSVYTILTGIELWYKSLFMTIEANTDVLLLHVQHCNNPLLAHLTTMHICNAVLKWTLSI